MRPDYVNGHPASLPISVSQSTLFLVMRNEAFRETALIGEALPRIAALLPEPWTFVDTPNARVEDQEVDAIFELLAPSGQRIPFAVEAKAAGSASPSRVRDQLRRLREATRLPVLYVSDYVAPILRTVLDAEDFNYVDATGWVRLSLSDPLIAITGQGAAKSPAPRASNAVVRLDGIAANRTIRALTMTQLPIGVRQLATNARTSPGSVSKLLATLAADGIVDRDERGAVDFVRCRSLVQRWARDYSFTKTNKSVGYYIAPRGIDRAMAGLGDSETAVALTGSAGARRLLPPGVTSVVPLRLLALYAAWPAELARELGLIEADAQTANVVIAVPQDGRVLASDGAATAPAALVLADLLTLPNRSDAEAEQLMDNLARSNEAWRE